VQNNKKSPRKAIFIYPTRILFFSQQFLQPSCYISSSHRVSCAMLVGIAQQLPQFAMRSGIKVVAQGSFLAPSVHMP
jgi:hypothetical protein